MQDRDGASDLDPEAAGAFPPGVLWGVGAVSRRLGIASPTLRSWDRRYGLGPSARTAGGHRRYSEADVARVERMSHLILGGVPSAEAARLVLAAESRQDAAVLASTRSASATLARTMLDAARDFDAPLLSRLIAQVLTARGVRAGWTDVVAPFLVTVGEEWAAGSIGVDVEHLASECVASGLRDNTTWRETEPGRRSRVLLAGAPEEQHVLPLLALSAALAEHKIGTVMLGGRTPSSALATAVDRVDPAVVLLWSSSPDTARAAPVPRGLPGGDAAPVLLLGGPGWGANDRRPMADRPGEPVADLGAAVDRIVAIAG